MKITVDREAFLKSLFAVARAVPSRTTKDVLKNILMIVDAAGVSLIATNTEIGMRIDLADVQIKGAGRLLLPANRICEVIREGDSAQVEIESSSKGFNVVMNGGIRSEFELLSEDPGDFPEIIKTFDDSDTFTMSAAEFRKLYRRTIFAVDEQSTRYALGGINVEFSGGAVRFVATDSRRLAVATGKYENRGAPTAPAVAPVVPTKAMKLVDSQADTVAIEVAFDSDKQIRFKIGAVTIQAALVQGRFPDWKKVMPGPARQTAKFVAAPFLGAVRQAMLVREKEGSAINFAFRKGFLKFLTGEEKPASKTDLFEESASIDLPIEYAGESFSAKFDPQYFSDFLKAIDSASGVELKLVSHEDPALLEVENFSYIIMPCSRD